MSHWWANGNKNEALKKRIHPIILLMKTYLRLVFCSVAALRACKELSLRRDYNGTLSGHSDRVWQYFSMPFLPSHWHFIKWCPVNFKLSRFHTGLDGLRLKDMYNGVAKIDQRVTEWQRTRKWILVHFLVRRTLSNYTLYPFNLALFMKIGLSVCWHQMKKKQPIWIFTTPIFCSDRGLLKYCKTTAGCLQQKIRRLLGFRLIIITAINKKCQWNWNPIVSFRKNPMDSGSFKYSPLDLTDPNWPWV